MIFPGRFRYCSNLLISAVGSEVSSCEVRDIRCWLRLCTVLCDLVVDGVEVAGVAQPVADHLQPALCPGAGELLEPRAAEAVPAHSAGVALGRLVVTSSQYTGDWVE